MEGGGSVATIRSQPDGRNPAPPDSTAIRWAALLLQRSHLVSKPSYFFTEAPQTHSGMVRPKLRPLFQPESEGIKKHRGWTYIATVVAAVFSTLLSGVFLVVASAAPQWGRLVGKHGVLDESSANVVVQLIAKLIEVTFVTSCLGALGQLLSRRALKPTPTSTRLSDLYMRNWIVQPGSLFTHFAPLWISGPTLLGALTVMAAVLSLLYTTAATALG